MPASAVASLTPAISGMAGTLVGASGETGVDIGRSGNRLDKTDGHGPGHPLLVARASLKTSMAGTSRAKTRCDPAMTFVNTTDCEEVTAIFTSLPAPFWYRRAWPRLALRRPAFPLPPFFLPRASF